MPRKRPTFPLRDTSVFLAVLFLIILMMQFAPVCAKMISATPKPLPQTAMVIIPGHTSTAFVHDYESRLKPYFASRINGPGAFAALPSSHYPRENDILLLKRLWNSLSPEFKALYKAAVSIPVNDKMYVSPGGHFEVFYTTTDQTNAVDTTDMLGFGDGLNWRVKTSGKNGIPDYVDEVAWALDSSWSLEINRLEFIAPLTVKDATHTSDRYRVVLTWLGPANYGNTWVDDNAAGASKGFTSHIELRNEWNSDLWNSLGYREHPENGVRVTCAHEFFHGIQYAMSWNSDNDDFPLSWLEGTAVLMEGLAFNDIKDYLQYTDSFFNDPQMSFFSPSFDGIYTNSLLTKFIYEKGSGSSRIDLIKNIFFRNYARMVPFHPNLRTTSLNLGTTWIGILNRFHTGSYFTGSRADTSLFLADAPLMKEWTYFRDTLSFSHTTTKTADPYGMALFDFAPNTVDSDTLSIILNCETTTLDTVPYPYWGATCVIQKPMRPDSLFALSIDPTGQAQCRIANWRQAREMLVIVSNGHPSAALKATVSPVACSVTYRAGDTVVFNDSVPATSSTVSPPDNFITVDLIAKSDLTCALVTSYINPASLPFPDRNILLSGVFGLSYPEFWGDDASVMARFHVRATYLESLKREYVVSKDSIAIWRYNINSSTWQKAPDVKEESADETRWRFSPAGPGMYALFMSELQARDTTRLVIAPNPAHLRDKKGMYFEGSRINDIRIYTANGSLVCTTRDSRNAFQRYSGGYVWQLVNRQGASVAPGYYTAIVTQASAITGANKSKINKVLVFP
jgi:hypothetical protein